MQWEYRTLLSALGESAACGEWRLVCDTVWSFSGTTLRLVCSHLPDFARQHRWQFDPQLLGVFEGGREAAQVSQRLNAHQTRSLFICRLGGKRMFRGLQ